MSSFKKLDSNHFDRKKQQTAESLYWRKFAEPTLVKEFGPVDFLDFSPVVPHNFAVTSSVRVQIYNPVTKTPCKNLNKFKVSAFGGSFRQDGNLVCAGSEDSKVRMFDVSTKKLLRVFNGHKSAVHRTFFTANKTNIASFSDDKSVILWDIATEKNIHRYQEHSDYIRAGCVSPVDPNVIISGGYDSIVKVYDTRVTSVICSLDHGAPIESCLFLPSGSIFITAGGKEVRIWDAFTRNMLAKCGSYHKTVTCMCLSRNGTKLMTGSLDHRVKIFDIQSHKVLHTLSYTSPILSIACSKDDKTFVTGSVSGIVTIQKRAEFVEEPVKKKVPVKFLGDTNSRGSDVVDTLITPMLKKDVLSRYETALRKYQYSKALDLVMVHQIAFKTPHVAVSLMDELIRRRGLHQALSNRNSKELTFILRFLIRYIHVERFMNVLIEVANCILDVYCKAVSNFSSDVNKLFYQLHSTVQQDLQITEELLQLQGCLEMIFAASNISNDSDEPATSIINNIQ